jgi:chromosome segregation ATPase
MIEVAAASLNTLPYPAVSPVSPTESTILNQILAELLSLRSEVAQLREERAQDLKEIEALKVKLEVLEATQDHQAENQFIQLRLINGLREEVHKDTEPKGHGSKVKDHLNEIYDALEARERACKGSAQKRDFMTFWEVEELLELSRARVSQLADIAKNDPRFTIGWHPKRKNAKIFKLNPFRSLGHIAAHMNELSKKIEN